MYSNLFECVFFIIYAVGVPFYDKTFRIHLVHLPDERMQTNSGSNNRKPLIF